ncbi:MAG: hypothetical protein IT385_16155 [Deltaproteobacteria bacterium]|nr:hypothetical protein [Deltaproteobacteria bacterium]
MASLAARIEALVRPLAVAGFKAAAEVVVPPNDLGAPDVAATRLERRFDRWLDELPPEARRLMLLLYGAVEALAPLAMPALGRFSRQPLASRTRLVERWRTSALMPLRFVAEAMKSPVVMMYLSEPDALRWLGAPAPEAR